MAKRFLTICVLIFFSLIHQACRPDYEVPPDHIRIQLNSEPTTLNPILATDAYARIVNSFVYQDLLDVDPDTLEYKPHMAERWTISRDKKTYTFYLHKDIKWEDGQPFTADDVVFSFNLLKDPKISAPHIKVYYQDVISAKKLDDHTVQFKMTKVYFRGLIMCGGMSILPKHIWEKEGDFEHSKYSRAPFGNGPFRFKKWDTNSSIVLERNEDYWGKKPEIRIIEFKVIPDPSIGLQILKKRMLDVYQLSTIEWVRQTKSKKFSEHFKKISYPGTGYSYLGWNLRSFVFEDKRVRQAMTMMLNRDSIRDAIYFGLANEVTGPFFAFGPQANPNIKRLPYDVEKAKELFKAAGWIDTNRDGILDKNGKKFKFTFVYPSGSKFSERLSTIMKENLKKVGIEMSIVRLEWAAYLDRLYKRDFDATNLSWATPFESDPYQVWHSTQADQEGSSNHIGFKNRRADWLIELARIEFNEKRRNQLYWKFREILYDEQPYTFLFNTPMLYAVSKRFDNVIVHKAGLDYLEWKIKTDKTDKNVKVEESKVETPGAKK